MSAFQMRKCKGCGATVIAAEPVLTCRKCPKPPAEPGASALLVPLPPPADAKPEAAKATPTRRPRTKKEVA